MLLAAGCHKATPPSLSVCLLDISASIYPDAVRDEFSAMDNLADHLHRGDELVIIPIASNARNGVQGHILRLHAPEERAAFDTDLAKFHQEAHVEIAVMKDWATLHPSAHTDILGTLQVAQQEVTSARAGNVKLILLSDFLEDDDKWNFVTDKALESAALARRLANSASLRSKLRFSSVYLGQLRSRDGAVLSTPRWDAVAAFWSELLNHSGQQQTVHMDGIGSLMDTVKNADAVEP
jgi:hypothetical protein